jgi:hypothetical protein
MGWLLRRGEVLASLDVHATAADNGAAEAEVGALLRRDVRVVTGFGASGRSDVAWLDGDLTVRSLGRVSRFGVRLAPRACKAVLSAERGAFERWRLEIGDQLEVRE